jgi:hypothetical protein
MRSVAFLLAICVVVPLVLAQTLSSPAPIDRSIPGATQMIPAHQTGIGERMWRRAEIRVVPLDLYLANKVELDSLRLRVDQTQADLARLEPPDPAARELLYRQQQLLKGLLNLAARQESNAGKGPAALDVQRHLNEIEGKVMCEACHTGVVARAASAR